MSAAPSAQRRVVLDVIMPDGGAALLAPSRSPIATMDRVRRLYEGAPE